MKDIVLIATFVCIIAAIIVIMIFVEKRRIRAMGEAIVRLGGVFSPKPDAMAKEEAFQKVGAPALLRHGSKGVHWVATLPMNKGTLTVIEHSYTSGSGKSKHRVTHVACSCACPEAWPDLTVRSEHLGDWLKRTFGSGDGFVVEHEKFNKMYQVETSDERFALLVLTPAVQEALVALRERTSLVIGSGAMTLLRRGPMTSKDMEKLPPALVGLQALLPKELDVYTPEWNHA